MADNYWGEMSQLIGIPYYPDKRIFRAKGGALIGKYDGYLLAIALVMDERKSAVRILLRFRQQQPNPALKTAIESSLAVQAALGTGELSKAQKQAIQTGADFVMWTWTYTMRKPEASKVAALAKALVETIKGMTSRFDEHCEKCGASSMPIVLLNNVPSYYCGGCQEKIRMERNAAAIAYDNLPTNLPAGLLYGVVAALGGSLAWGLIAYAANRIWLYAAFLIGLLVGWAVIKGTGKINTTAKAAIFVLTIASVLFGDAIFFTLSLMKITQQPFSTRLLNIVLTHFVDLERQGQGLISLVFGLIGAGFTVYRFRKPRFSATFETLDSAAAKPMGAM